MGKLVDTGFGISIGTFRDEKSGEVKAVVKNGEKMKVKGWVE